MLSCPEGAKQLRAQPWILAHRKLCLFKCPGINNKSGHAKGRHWYCTTYPAGSVNWLPNEIVLNTMSNVEKYLSVAEQNNVSKTCRAANKTISGRFKSIS